MKRVYLDQNKWIDLAAAAKGLEKGAPYHDVLTLAEAGVERGYVSFPLSAIHYIETGNRRPWQSRQDLARTMATLSRFHTIAPVNVIVPHEIDLALQGVVGLPLVARDAQVFGIGVSHAMNHPMPAFRVPEHMRSDSEFVRWVEGFAADYREWVMLGGLPPEAGIDESEFDAAQKKVGERLAEDQERFRLSRRDGGWHTGERSKRASRAIAFVGWRDELTEALMRAGLNWSHVQALGRDGMSRLVEAIPIIHVAAELQRQREAAADKPWTPNDVNDMFFLMVALVYCDIVVTERQWIDLARRSSLDERYGTTLLSDLADLSAHLI